MLLKKFLQKLQYLQQRKWSKPARTMKLQQKAIKGVFVNEPHNNHIKKLLPFYAFVSLCLHKCFKFGFYHFKA